MIIKNEKGITLTTLILTIVLILIIGGMMGYYSTSGLNLKRINNMYSDIEQIQTEVDTYYLKNNELPILNVNVSFSKYSNPNDNSEYYVIDLSKLGNLKLNYGKKFENIKSRNNLENYTDVYIINKQSQTIYYLKGIEFEDNTYYTKPIEYKEIKD